MVGEWNKRLDGPHIPKQFDIELEEDTLPNLEPETLIPWLEDDVIIRAEEMRIERILKVERLNHGPCTCPKLGQEVDNELDPDTNSYKESMESDTLTFDERENPESPLMTGKDFGCVHWEEKTGG